MVLDDHLLVMGGPDRRVLGWPVGDPEAAPCACSISSILPLRVWLRLASPGNPQRAHSRLPGTID